MSSWQLELTFGQSTKEGFQTHFIQQHIFDTRIQVEHFKKTKKKKSQTNLTKDKHPEQNIVSNIE